MQLKPGRCRDDIARRLQRYNLAYGRRGLCGLRTGTFADSDPQQFGDLQRKRDRDVKTTPRDRLETETFETETTTLLSVEIGKS